MAANKRGGESRNLPKEKQENKTKEKWLIACRDYWCVKIDESDLGIDWADALDGKGRCYRCGLNSQKPQKCHIVPRSLGGSDATSNIIPLCPYCHDEQPDVASAEYTWAWIKKTRCCYYGELRWKRVCSFIDWEKYDFRTFDEKVFRQKANQGAGVHLMQLGSGPRIKDSTFAWCIEQACKERKADDGED